MIRYWCSKTGEFVNTMNGKKPRSGAASELKFSGTYDMWCELLVETVYDLALKLNESKSGRPKLTVSVNLAVLSMLQKSVMYKSTTGTLEMAEDFSLPITIDEGQDDCVMLMADGSCLGKVVVLSEGK